MARGLRFHLDESCRFSIAKGLRLHGVDVTTSGEVGLISATDVEQLAFCHLRGRILFTHDADFVVLHDAGAEHSGIVYCHQRLRSVGDIIRGLLLIWEVYEPQEMKNRLEYL